VVHQDNKKEHHTVDPVVESRKIEVFEVFYGERCGILYLIV